MSEPNPSLEKFLFEAALGKSSEAERVAFLDEVCRGYPALRARLDLLLEGEFQAHGFMKGGARKVEQKPAPPAAEDEAASTFIGRYIIAASENASAVRREDAPLDVAVVPFEACP
jgi:hypothetical protein